MFQIFDWPSRSHSVGGNSENMRNFYNFHNFVQFDIWSSQASKNCLADSKYIKLT